MADQPFKVFVISLERATRRRAHMQALLGRLGLEAEFVTAVDGQALTPVDRRQYDSKQAWLNYRAEMSDAEIACYLSHYRVYERICRDKLPIALILEDDIEIESGLVDIVSRLARQIDPEWTVVRLQSQREKVVHPTSLRTRGQAVCDLGPAALYRLDTHVLGGCAYLMRYRAAQTMLAYGWRISRPIDQTLDRYWENGIVPYVVRPFPVRQHPDFGSEIGARGRAVCVQARRRDVLRGRLRRALDGVSKRAFKVALHTPWVRTLIARPYPPALYRGRGRFVQA
jgi:glycosyl transferase family 25